MKVISETYSATKLDIYDFIRMRISFFYRTCGS